MNSLPPIKPIQLEKQKTIAKKQISPRPQLPDQNQDCVFFKLPCTAKSQQNKDTLNNEKSSLNETNLELPRNKSLALKTQPAQNPMRTLVSDQRTHQKGIRISMQNKRPPLNINRPVSAQKSPQIIEIPQCEPQNTISINVIPAESPENKEKSFHQLSPLSIDRNKYDANDIKLGGNKGTIQSRVSFNSSFKVPESNQSFGTLKSVPTTVIKPNATIKIIAPVSALPLPSTPYHYSYQQGSSYTQNRVFCESVLRNLIKFDQNAQKAPKATHERLPTQNTVRPKRVNISFNRSKTESFEQDSGFTKNNESTNYQKHNTSMNEPSCFEQTQQLFNNIQISNSPQNGLQNSTHSNYSQKYRKYMEKELFMPHHLLYKPQVSEMPELMENVRVEVDSVNQEQNQKNQTTQTPFAPKSNNTDLRSERKGSYSSSFMVVQGKQRSMENTKKIYLPSNIDTGSIPESGFMHQLDQFMLEDGQNPPNINSEREWVSIGEISELNELQHDVEILQKTFENLRAEQKALVQENQQLCSMKINELEAEIKLLQNLKSISEERQQQIDYLKELLKVKLIQKKFNQSPTLKGKYLNDEKGWEKYISFTGESRCLNESNETNQTQN